MPLTGWCSAKASSALATGPAGWMTVRRCVSSKSKICELMPLNSAACSGSVFSGAAEDAGGAGAGEGAEGGDGDVERLVMRPADGAAGPVDEGAGGLFHHVGGRSAEPAAAR